MQYWCASYTYMYAYYLWIYCNFITYRKPLRTMYNSKSMTYFYKINKFVYLVQFAFLKIVISVPHIGRNCVLYFR